MPEFHNIPVVAAVKTVWVHDPDFAVSCNLDEMQEDGTLYRLSDAASILIDAEEYESEGTPRGRFVGRVLREAAERLIQEGVNQVED